VNQLQSKNNVDDREIRVALAKILSDVDFQGKPNSAQFLRFVVEETMAGRGDRLKGFTIATSALGRNSDFDPQSSSVVRVQANRLRRWLEDYYLGRGSQDPVRIVLPVGSYQPQFERRAAVEPASPAEVRATSTQAWSRRESAALHSWRIVAIAIAASLTISGAVLLVRSFPPGGIAADARTPVRAPIVVVESANRENASKEEKQVTELAVVAIENGLSVSDQLDVERRTGPTQPNNPDYALLARAGPPGGVFDDFLFQLVYLPTSAIVWSRTFRGINLSAQASIDRMSQIVVSDVGDVAVGAIVADQRRRAASSHAPQEGYYCVLAATDYLITRAIGKHDPARACLEREVARNPKDSRVIEALFFVLLYDYVDLLPGANGPEDIERVGKLAQLAFETSPSRSETSTMLFQSRFYALRFDDAFALAPRLLENIPNSRLLSATIGSAYVARGRYEEGVAILSPSEETTFGAPGFSVPMLALAAYMRGDEETAERFASRAVAARQPMGLVMRIVICQTQKRQVCVGEASQQLRRDYPGFAADLPTALFRHALADDIQAKLLSDLRAAGFFG